MKEYELLFDRNGSDELENSETQAAYGFNKTFFVPKQHVQSIINTLGTCGKNSKSKSQEWPISAQEVYYLQNNKSKHSIKVINYAVFFQTESRLKKFETRLEKSEAFKYRLIVSKMKYKDTNVNSKDICKFIEFAKETYRNHAKKEFCLSSLTFETKEEKIIKAKGTEGRLKKFFDMSRTDAKYSLAYIINQFFTQEWKKEKLNLDDRKRQMLFNFPNLLLNSSTIKKIKRIDVSNVDGHDGSNKFWESLSKPKHQREIMYGSCAWTKWILEKITSYLYTCYMARKNPNDEIKIKYNHIDFLDSLLKGD